MEYLSEELSLGRLPAPSDLRSSLLLGLCAGPGPLPRPSPGRARGRARAPPRPPPRPWAPRPSPGRPARWRGGAGPQNSKLGSAKTAIFENPGGVQKCNVCKSPPPPKMQFLKIRGRDKSSMFAKVGRPKRPIFEPSQDDQKLNV